MGNDAIKEFRYKHFEFDKKDTNLVKVINCKEETLSKEHVTEINNERLVELVKLNLHAVMLTDFDIKKGLDDGDDKEIGRNLRAIDKLLHKKKELDPNFKLDAESAKELREILKTYEYTNTQKFDSIMGPEEQTSVSKQR